MPRIALHILSLRPIIANLEDFLRTVQRQPRARQHRLVFRWSVVNTESLHGPGRDGQVAVFGWDGREGWTDLIPPHRFHEVAELSTEENKSLDILGVVVPFSACLPQLD